MKPNSGALSFLDKTDWYCLYMKWNGRKDLRYDGLKPNTVYRVTPTRKFASGNSVSLQEIPSGKKLRGKYSAESFHPISIHSGYSTDEPKLDEPYSMMELDPGSKTFFSHMTPKVIWIERIGGNTWCIITRNSANLVTICPT